MAAGGDTASWALDLDTSAMQMGAEEAADKLVELQKEIRKTADLQKALKGGGEDAKKQARAYGDQLAQQKAQAKSLQLAMAKQGTTVREVQDRQRSQAASSVKAHKWDLDRAKMKADWDRKLLSDNRKATDIAKARGAANAKMFGAMKAGAVGVAAAIVALGAVTSGWIVKTQGARREELLRLQGLAMLRRYSGDGAAVASQMQASIDRVSASSAASRSQVAGMAEQLYKAGVRGRNLTIALEGAAIVATTQGDEMAQAFIGQAAAAGYMGTSVEKLTDRVKSRLGGIATKQALAFDVQVSKLKDNLGMMVKRFNIEPMLKGINTALSVFREGEAVAQAWQTILETVFGSSFAKGEESGLLLKRAIQGVTLAALKMASFAQDVRLAVEGMVPKALHDNFVQAWADVRLGETAFRALGAAGESLGYVFKGIGRTLLGSLLGPIGILGALVWNVAEGFDRAYNVIKGLGWAELGVAIVKGIGDGMLQAGKLAVDSAVKVAGDIKRGFTDFFDIHSPSRLMAKAVGEQIPKGIGVGEERAADSAIAPMTRAFDAAIPGRGGSSGSTSGGVTITIGDIVIQSDGRDTFGDLKSRVTELFEDLAMQLGAAHG